MFSQVPAWEGGAFQGGLTVAVEAERWVFHRKTCVKEMTQDGSHQSLRLLPSAAATGLGSRSKCGPQTSGTGCPAGDSRRSPELGSRPDLLDQNLHFNETWDSFAHYSLRSPEAQTHEFLLADRWHGLLPFLISCLVYLHTGGNDRAI